jgi:hypothetical protein
VVMSVPISPKVLSFITSQLNDNKYLSLVNKILLMISFMMPYLKSYYFRFIMIRDSFFSHESYVCVRILLHYTIYNMLPDIAEYSFVCSSRLESNQIVFNIFKCLLSAVGDLDIFFGMRLISIHWQFPRTKSADRF